MVPSWMQSVRIPWPIAHGRPYLSVSSQGMAWEPKLTQRKRNSDGQRVLPSAPLACLLGSTRKDSAAASGFSKYHGAGVQAGAHTPLNGPRLVSSGGLCHHFMEDSLGFPSIPHRESHATMPTASKSWRKASSALRTTTQIWLEAQGPAT